MPTTVNICDASGQIVATEVIDDDPFDAPSAAVLAAVQTARDEVAGLSPTGATRQAVEALCAAVESLATT